MSQPSDVTRLELHLFSPSQYHFHLELLTVIAHYHRTGNRLELGHTVNFGRPWMEGSACEFGLVSLPYLDGPEVEDFFPEHGQSVVKCLWLIPITKTECKYKAENGLEALERRFDEAELDYLDPFRFSTV